ncbi:MAG: LacI family DNA-binding transcriptional regulator [Aggregatilineales bacterium]
MPTIKDVAKEAGVSIATVSYVLNNRNDMVGEQTRQHVLKIASKLGYKPNIIARNLQSSKTSLIGYAWHQNPADQPNLVMDQFIYFLAQAAESANYHLLTFTHPNDDPIAVYDELIRSGRVDGFVLSETTYDDPRIKYLMGKKVPFVSFGRSNPAWYFNWVDTDGQVGTRLVTEHLLDLGHRRIAFLGWPKYSLTGNHRLAGYTEALENANIDLREDFVVHNDYANNSIERAFSYWQSLPANETPTAVVAVSDFVAIAAMRIAEQCGYQIGETMSIAGFDDAPFVRYLQSGLTTLRQPWTEICQLLINRLDALIHEEKAPEMNTLVLPELVIRGSTGAPLTDE